MTGPSEGRGTPGGRDRPEEPERHPAEPGTQGESTRPEVPLGAESGSPPTEPPSEAPDAVASPRRRVWRNRLVAGAVVPGTLLLLVLLYQLVTWPHVEALARENPETTAFVERWEERTGREARQTWVPYERISPHLKRAVLVSEDIDFFSHDGFDTDQIRDALDSAWERKRFPRGASTISQQLAKNLWLSPSRNPLRKVKEALLTVQLERNLSKRRILELYLNVVELGPGVFGAEAASRHWFGTGAANLTERQAAQLAAALPNPDDWHPGTTSRTARRRVQTILRRMDRARFLWKVI